MERRDVSVVIPAYNEELMLRSTVSAVANCGMWSMKDP
jgi:glycosyltransferase involved in cell wall biosynthesis